jgi:hypothetical protein
MVLLWTAVSYLPAGNIPKGIPRRLFTPNPWSHGAYENWTVIKALLLNNPKIFNAYFHFIIFILFTKRFHVFTASCTNI